MNIRRSVFETNSSSMHSVSISDVDHLVTYNEPIFGRFGEFGWGYEELTSVEDKLSYVLTSIQYYDSSDEYTIENSQFYIWLNEMVKDFTGFEIDLKINYGDFHPIGYVDHQSINILNEYWDGDEIKFKENMKELIFNQKYKIIIDNDNH